ncbi:MAG: hypothetical protein ACI87O_002086 [Planctomycetota bacterium]|jgi:hypothetical protein
MWKPKLTSDISPRWICKQEGRKQQSEFVGTWFAPSLKAATPSLVDSKSPGSCAPPWGVGARGIRLDLVVFRRSPRSDNSDPPNFR